MTQHKDLNDKRRLQDKKRFFLIPFIFILSIFGHEFRNEFSMILPLWISSIVDNAFIFCFWICLATIFNCALDRLIWNKMFGPESPGQPRQRKLVTQLIHFSILCIGFGLAMKQILSPELGTMVAGSGVIAIVLGLALQSTLGDFFAGVALNIERPFKAGEWLTLEDKTEGLVLSTNWRSTHIKTRTNDVVIIPNATLAKQRMTNRTRPDLSHVATLSVKLIPGFPYEVAELKILESLAKVSGIILQPAPLFTVESTSDWTCTIKAYYLIDHYENLLHIQCSLGAETYKAFNNHPELRKYWPLQKIVSLQDY